VTGILTGTERGVPPETDRRGTSTGVTWWDLHPSTLVVVRCGVPLRRREVTNPLLVEVGLRGARGLTGEGIWGGEKDSCDKRGTMHLRNSKGPNGDLWKVGEVGVHKNAAGGARGVVDTTVAPLVGSVQGVPPRECQDSTNVLGRVREVQQRVWESWMSGG
jgi:hypothetical protein